MKADEIFNFIYEWNKERELLTEFKHHLEVMLLAEELFELCGYGREEAKSYARAFASQHSNISSFVKNDMQVIATNPERLMKTSDVADALGDIIFISIGSLYKLGYNPVEVLSKICEHNERKGKEKDKFGKVIKDSNFVEPNHDNAKMLYTTFIRTLRETSE